MLPPEKNNDIMGQVGRVITRSDHNQYQDGANYFTVLGMSVQCDELEVAEQLLALIEKFSETQLQ